MGGIGWRSGYAKAVVEKTGGKVAVLQVDAGHLFETGSRPGLVLVDNAEVKNEWVLRACDVLGFRAANVTGADLSFLAKFTETAGYEDRVRQYPALTRFVSANVVPEDAKHVAFKPYVIEEVASERFGSSPLRVGILGVTYTTKNDASIHGYKLTDPMAAIRKYAREVRAKSDVFVILAYLDKNALRGVEPAAGVPVDAIVASYEWPLQLLDRMVDAPVYTYPPSETKAISEIRFYPPANGEQKRYGKIRSRYVVLTDAIPVDPVADKLTWDAAKQYRKT
jgi:hypothetical protein